MLTIAVPKGALYDDAVARLRAAGIDVPDDVGPQARASITSDGHAAARSCARPTCRRTSSSARPIAASSARTCCGRRIARVSELADLGFG